MTRDEALVVFADCKRAYQLAFGQGHGEAVLKDLETFWCARVTCVVPGDPYMTYVLEGRREVYLRIRDYLDLTVEELVDKYTIERPATGATSHG